MRFHLSWTTCCLLISSAALVSSYDCSSIHTEVTSGVLNYLANVTIVVPIDTVGKGWAITFKFDQPFTGIGIWVGVIENYGDLMYAIMRNNDETQDLRLNQIFTFSFRINFGREIPAPPKLTSLEFYDIQMCKFNS